MSNEAAVNIQTPDDNEVSKEKKGSLLKKIIKVIFKFFILCVFSAVAFGLSYPLFFDQWMDGTQVWYSLSYVIVRYPLKGEDVKIYPIPYDYFLSHDRSDWCYFIGCENLWNKYEAPFRGMTFEEYKQTQPPYTGHGGILEQWEQHEMEMKKNRR